MSLTQLLAQPNLSVITRSADHELAKIHDLIEHKVLVDGRADLEELLSNLLAVGAPPTPKTLDLIGLSTAGHSLLMLGDWVIDAANPCVASFFRGLADQEVLPRLGIHGVRLLGCLTADSGHARWTICKLAEILGVDVFGTRDLIFSIHYDRGGFAHTFRHALACSADLREESMSTHALARGEPHHRVLDVDALPAEPLAAGDRGFPYRIADAEQARALLRLVRRRDGALMPGLLAKPHCEVALPAPQQGCYHRAQILLDGELIRVYPEGIGRPAVVYPVEDPYTLKTIVDRLPLVS